MDRERSSLPAIGHSGSMGCPPPPPTASESHHVPYLEVPTITAPGWWSILAGTGMPRRNSVGFSENCDTAPPFCLDDDNATTSENTTFTGLKPPSNTQYNQSPPVRRREMQSTHHHDLGVPSPSDEFLTQYWSKHHGSGKALLDAQTSDGSKISVFVSHCDDDVNCVTTAETLLVPASRHHNHQLNVPISSKIAESIHMEDFPVVTRESLAQLDRLKKEILNSNFDSKPIVEKVSQEVAPTKKVSGPLKKISEQLDHVEPEHGSAVAEHEVEKPPSRLVSYIMSQPFTQNWLFQNPNVTDEAEDVKPPTTTSETKKARNRHMNVWAPQNL